MSRRPPSSPSAAASRPSGVSAQFGCAPAESYENRKSVHSRVEYLDCRALDDHSTPARRDTVIRPMYTRTGLAGTRRATEVLVRSSLPVSPSTWVRLTRNAFNAECRNVMLSVVNRALSSALPAVELVLFAGLRSSGPGSAGYGQLLSAGTGAPSLFGASRYLGVIR
jgi:hypothetical protein